MSMKWMGVYSGFFVLALALALFVTGVFQERIMPRLHRQEGAEAVKPEQAVESPKEPTAGKAATGDEPRTPENSRPNEPPSAAPTPPAVAQEPAPKPGTPALSEKQGQVKRLARLYEGMRPKEAATVLEKLDRPLAAGVLSEIKDRQAAKILGAMSPGTAAELTRLLGQTATGETP
ncbi:MAG TPA: hypothetical protein VLT62_30010 [Candidatus Methylomirabilis sp.]|nr:hypothetical protein [Candidatus Methylomirabilis sp.]